MHCGLRVSTAFLVIFMTILTSLGISAQTAIDLAMAGLWERSDLPVADLSIVPPPGRHQPVAGFGKVWRE